MTPDHFRGEHGPSIFFIARLQMLPVHHELNSVSHFHATIDELGFGQGWLSRFSSEPPRDPRFDTSYTDRFFYAQSGKSRGRSLARVEIDEANVYDWQLRSEVDYTGFRLSVTLSEEAFRPFLKDLASRASREEFCGPIFAVRMASKPFPFPKLRGSPSPFPGPGEATQGLKAIKYFKVNELSVAFVEYKTPHVKWSPEMGLGERYNVLSAQKFFMTRG